MKKVVLFDLMSAQPSGSSKFHGGGEYIKAIFREMVKEYSDKAEIVPFYNSDKFIDEWIIGLIKAYNLKCYDIKQHEDLKQIFTEFTPDVFFSGLPAVFKKEWFPENVKLIGTVHGLRKIEKPHDVTEPKYLDGKNSKISSIKLKIRKFVGNGVKYRSKFILQQKYVLDLLDVVITDSEHTYYAIKYYYPESVNSIDIKVYYPPNTKTDIDCQNNKAEVTGDYILMLGGDRWLKNVYRALKAVDSLYDRGYLKGVRTVVVGKTSQSIRSEMKHTGNYIWNEYVDNVVLENLYANCSIFVYPSLNEGFGYPPLEAMRYGKTCVVSAVCSMPEICGDAVYYTNPYDVEEIANRILRANDKKICTEKIKAQYDLINNRQNIDLQNICKCILGLCQK